MVVLFIYICILYKVKYIIMRVYLVALLLVFIGLTGFSSYTKEVVEERPPLPCLNKKFSIIAHIVKDSLGSAGIAEASILAKINSVNSYFSDICVSFEVCEFRYIDNFQYDSLVAPVEWSLLQTDYHEANRINMFFVKATHDGASFASLGGVASLNNGGIVIVKSHGLMVWVHEMGHYFGLEHTFEGAGTANAELVDGSNCLTAGDGICDTPADPFIVGSQQSDWLDTITCEYTYMGQDANGDYYTPYIGNIMSYYKCARCRFTYEQYLRMANTYLNSNPKMW